MLNIERKKLILAQLQTNKRVIVSDLAGEFSVSHETIRRDLDKLCAEGHAIKAHGGAVLAENQIADLPFDVRKTRNVEGKQKIARLVSGLVAENDFIILDPSSTAGFAAKELKTERKQLGVLTNSLEIMLELSDMRDWRVLSPGGALLGGYLALLGEQTIETLNAYNADKLIFSCKGIDTQRGLTDGSDGFAFLKRAMIKAARIRILAADRTKFGKTALSRIDGFADIDIVVTDTKPSGEWLEFFAEQEIHCIYE